MLRIYWPKSFLNYKLFSAWKPVVREKQPVNANLDLLQQLRTVVWAGHIFCEQFFIINVWMQHLEVMLIKLLSGLTDNVGN